MRQTTITQSGAPGSATGWPTSHTSIMHGFRRNVSLDFLLFIFLRWGSPVKQSVNSGKFFPSFPAETATYHNGSRIFIALLIICLL